MPWYVYKCKSCGAELSMVQATTDPIMRLIKCNVLRGAQGACGGRVERVGDSGSEAMTLQQLQQLARGVVVKS